MCQTIWIQIRLSGIPSECQIVWIQIGHHKMSGLIWVQTVFKLSADGHSRQRINSLSDKEKNTLVCSKTCLKQPLKRKTKIGFQDRLSLNAGQKYCRMLQGEHSAILSAYIKLPFAIKTFVLSIFEWLLKAGFTVVSIKDWRSRPLVYKRSD